MRSTSIWVWYMTLVSFLSSASSVANIAARSLFFPSNAVAQVLKRILSLRVSFITTWANLYC
jgi:hypothetical protein